MYASRVNFRALKEIGVEEHDGDVRFRPEVVIQPFRACAMKNTQYNAYLWPNRRNSFVMKEIGVEEHDGDVKFYTGSGNTAVSRMRNEKKRNITLIYGRIAEILAS